MNLFDQIEEGKELIRNGKTLGKNVETLEEQVKRLEEVLKHNIEQMRLSEIEKREMAIKIYSDVLCDEIWLCSNEELSAQVQNEDPGVVCYIISELRELIRNCTNPDNLKIIHDAKCVFPNSRIIEQNGELSHE